MKIREAFENFWKIKSMNKKFKEKDKERYYDLFLDGYGYALIRTEDSPTKTQEKLIKYPSKECPNPMSKTSTEMKAKDFSKAIDKSGLRGYQFKDSAKEQKESKNGN